ncbi:ATP-binding protein [Rosistilla oblonga]|uniref:ATP-binding protein n=1 Tax=Rosistilla oblonga TaxID=2527990 RepID=UPI003A97720B
MSQAKLASDVSPTSLTAGKGMFFEVDVVAACLVELISEQAFQNQQGTRLAQVSVQKQDDRWKLDDILLHYESDRAEEWLIPVSVKSFSLFSKTAERREFVHHAWSDFLAGERRPRTFDRGRDRLGLFAKFDGSPRLNQIETLVEKARQQNDSFATRIVVQGNLQDAEKWLKWLELPDSLADFDPDCMDSLQPFIASLHVRNFDFGSTTSLSLQTVHEHCRLMCVREEAASGVQLWRDIWDIAKTLRLSGGDIDRGELIHRLKFSVQLKASPRFNAAFQILGSRSDDDLQRQPRKLGGDVEVTRPNVGTLIDDYFESQDFSNAFILGDSGVGKSTAVATAIEKSSSLIEPFFFRLETACEIIENESALFSPYTLREIFSGTSERSKVIVIDGIEQAADRSQIIKLAKFVLAAKHVPTLRVVLVCQREQYQRVLRFLDNNNVDAKNWKRIVVDSFSPDEAIAAIKSRPSLMRLYLSPTLPSLYRRPIILDAFFRIASNQDLSHLDAIGESHLIHWVWEHRISAEYGTDVSNLLLELGRRQGDESELETSQSLLPAFASSIDAAVNGSLLVRKQMKLRFAHDIYADWSRMLWLLDQGRSLPDALEAKSSRPKWYRAIRMVGIHFLEQDTSTETWLQYVGKGTAVSDLFLDAVVFSANPDELLENLSEPLFDSNARLAKRLVRRAMVICSVPGLLAAHREAAGEELTSVLRTIQRDPKPYHAAFGSLLKFLARHVGAVVEHMPHDAAKISQMWLEMTPTDWEFRAEASKIAIAVCESQIASHRRWISSDDEEREDIFKAVFFAFEEDPQSVTPLLLDAAGLNPDHHQAKLVQESALEWEKERSEIFNEPVRDLTPWPNGPAYPPHAAFRKACLDGDAMWPIFKDAPELATRLVLAVSIKVRSEDVDEEYHVGRIEFNENGIERLFDSMTGKHYRQGPYLSYLAVNPEAAIKLICKFANFAASRQLASIERSGSDAVVSRVRSPMNNGVDWLGDEHSFHWNRGLMSACASVVPALSALEKYLGDQMESGKPLDQLLVQLLQQCECVAIAGVLFDVGRRHPLLFQGPLKPLLTSPVLLLWAETISVNPKQPGFCNVSLDYEEWFFDEHKAWLLAEFRSKSIVEIVESVVDVGELDWSDPATANLKQRLPSTDRMSDVVAAISDLAARRRVGQLIVIDEPADPQLVETESETSPLEVKLLQNAIFEAHAIEEWLNLNKKFPESKLPCLAKELLTQREESDDPVVASVQSNNRLGVLLILLLRHEQWLVENGLEDETVLAILALLETPMIELSDELIDAGAVPRFLNQLAELAVYLLARDADNVDYRRWVFQCIVNHRGCLHGAITRAAWGRWPRLGPWGPRIIRLLFDTASAFWYLPPSYPTWPRDSTGFDKDAWLTSREEQFLAGTYQDSIPVLDELSLTPPRFFWADWRSSRRLDDEQCYKQLPVEESILESIVRNTPLCVHAESEDQRSARMATVQVLLDYELEILQAYSTDGKRIHRQDDGHPTMHGQREILQRIEAEIKYAVDPEHAALLWRQVFDLGVRSPKWIEQLIHSWMGPIITESENATKFAQTWLLMLQYVENHDDWNDPEDVEGWDPARAELLASLLCVDGAYGSYWSDSHAELINSMRETIQPFLREVVEDPTTAASALRWISRKAGSCFLPQAVSWCQEIGKRCNSPGADTREVQTLVMFLDVAYREHTDAMTGEYQKEFYDLVSSVARSENAMAIELQQRIADL